MEVDGLMVDPSMVGALPPPPGVIPNLFNPYAHTDLTVATIAVCLAVATPLLWARMYTKLFITRLLGWDDYLSLVAWFGFVAYCALALVGNKWGIGAHEWNVSLARAPTASKLANALEIFYAPLIFVTKLSLLLQYIRIFIPHHTGPMYWTAQAIIWFNLLLYTAVMFVEIFECTPREKAWNPLLPGQCINIIVAFITTAAFNVVSDVVMLILPLNAIWQLHMPKKRKWVISAVFGTGIFAFISSVARLVESVKFANTADQTWQLTALGLWTVAELCCGIIIGCLPAIPKFYSHFFSLASIKTKQVSWPSSSSTRKPVLDDSQNKGAHTGEYYELNRGAKTIKTMPMDREDRRVQNLSDKGWREGAVKDWDTPV